MAAPTPSARVDPTGIRLDDGYSTLITLAVDTDISFWEKTVTPPGLDGRDPIDTTTMHNERVVTKAPRSLIDVTDATATVAYDPLVYDQCLSALNVRTTVTIRFPDGGTYCFFGFLQAFTPQEMSEGEQPEAEVTICVTNFDPVNHVEALPVLTNVAGT